LRYFVQFSMKIFFIVAGLALVAASRPTPMSTAAASRGSDPDWPAFVRFVHQFERRYTSIAEVHERFDNFKDVLERNVELRRNSPSATFGINKFSDMSVEEFRRTHLMPAHMAKKIHNWRIGLKHKYTPPSPRTVRPLTDDVDWCAKGMCTAIKDQGQCGSCWAFSATESVESAAIAAGKFSKDSALSPEQIVDCDTASSGCGGGDERGAIDYVANCGGLELDSDYPYTAGQSGQAGSCEFNPSSVAVKISSSIDVGDNDEDKLRQYLLNTGPASVAVDASAWQSYSGGVMTPDQCGTQLDHAVQAVGIVTQDGQDAYKVRNSWGTGWGADGGYIYLQTGGNTCGIASEVSAAQM